MNHLQPDEQQLVGQWINAEGRVQLDDTAQRIEHLLKVDLERICASTDGWTVLFRDVRDGRYWELTYPHSEWHGGGPPAITNVSEDDAKAKYTLE